MTHGAGVAAEDSVCTRVLSTVRVPVDLMALLLLVDAVADARIANAPVWGQIRLEMQIALTPVSMPASI